MYKNIGWNFLHTHVKRVIQKEGKTWWGYINYPAAETQGGSELTPPAVKMAGYVTIHFKKKNYGSFHLHMLSSNYYKGSPEYNQRIKATTLVRGTLSLYTTVYNTQ